jgi:hypothetical protein
LHLGLYPSYRSPFPRQNKKARQFPVELSSVGCEWKV